jgi:DNA-binding NtrC family response regulator
MPPLRQRREDILALAYYFLKQASEPDKTTALSMEAVRLFLDYPWPGNVRELSNAVKQAVAFADEGIILPRHLPLPLRQGRCSEAENETSRDKGGALPPPSMFEHEKAAIIAALKYCRGSIPEAASVLGIGQATLYRKINKLNLIPG